MNIQSIGAVYAAKDFRIWSDLPGFKGLSRTEEGAIVAKLDDNEVPVTASKEVVISILHSKGLRVTRQRLDDFYMGYAQFMANRIA